MNASAETSASDPSKFAMEIAQYDVDITVRADRKLEYKEKILLKANKSGSVFRRQLPMEGDRYSDITANCAYEGFRYAIETDEETDYLNIACYAPISKGSSRIFEIGYTLELARNDVKNGMRLDVIGYGWSVPLQNVTVTMHFPSALQDHSVTVGAYGTDEGVGAEKVVKTLDAEKKTLTLHADYLDLAYNNIFHETMAEGITVRLSFSDGALKPYFLTRVFTDDMWKIALGGLLVVGLAVLALVLTRKKRDLVTVVNIKAPDDMDPLTMGYALDGTVDNEDLTSMIYYFAHKGWLKINFRDQSDPELISIVKELPDTIPEHQRTLFEGLFAAGRDYPLGKDGLAGWRCVKVSELVNRFFTHAQTAKKQVPAPKPMYESKSVWGFISGCVLGSLFALAAFYLMGKTLDKSYKYLLGGLFALPNVANTVIGYIRENYRYKWKKGKREWLFVAQIAIALVFVGGFTWLAAEHISTGAERFVIGTLAVLPPFITMPALSRSEKYLEVLGDIVGFKDFIIVTEEEKIKFMLEENPELYYKILPYAQVLGVTNEWEEKFARITVQPPNWYVGDDLTVFDCFVITRCLNRAITNALIAEAASKAAKVGGSFAGRSGGGGRFGGFGGGGGGGGGGSWR